MRIEDIGELKGEVLVFGGVYSNLQALEELKAIATKRNVAPTNIICTGDLVAYCAQPIECLDLLMDWGIHIIAGNVEIQLSSGAEDCGCDFTKGGTCDVLSKQWFSFLQQNVKGKHLAFLKSLPNHIRFKYQQFNGLVVHGSSLDCSEYIFRSTPWEVKEANFLHENADLILCGHSGLPFSQNQDGKHWINAGVIGMPANDATTSVWYATIDALGEELQVKHHNFEYNHLKAAGEMAIKGLPQQYAKTLATGLWDNCEILPDQETKEQGQKLHL